MRGRGYCGMEAVSQKKATYLGSAEPQLSDVAISSKGISRLYLFPSLSIWQPASEWFRRSEQLDIGQSLEINTAKGTNSKKKKMSSLVFYPTSPKEALVKEFVGKSIADVPTPAAVMNVAAARRNCERMLEAAKKLDLGWRAHVKTHKVSEESFAIEGEMRLMVGGANLLLC